MITKLLICRNGVSVANCKANILLPRGVELNAGIVCSCMPVAFVTFKRVTTTSWTSIKNYLMARRLGSSRSTTAHGSEPKFSDGSASSNQLPKIPHPTMTGLRTFIRGGRSNNMTDVSGAETYTELRSVDENYHTQLKRAQGTEFAVPKSRDGRKNNFQ